jgi:aryl-phospho-beta-D-glucosidase BglC (GH1 family)
MGAPDAPYQVQGAQIIGASGKAHLFRGLARPSLEWNSTGDQLSSIDYTWMQSVWNANVVRIPLNQDFWLSDSPIYDAGYAGTVDQQVQWAESANMDVILDLHWSDGGSYSVVSLNSAGSAQCSNTGTGANCQQEMADAHSVTFWQQVASKYKGDSHVLFELYNEPYIGRSTPSSGSWGTWLNGGGADHGMQELYNTVRGTGAQNLVIVGGLAWAGTLQGMTPVNGTNILYAAHPYQNISEGTWNSAFGTLSQTYPIIVTEFGDRSGGCGTQYDSDFVAYANKKGSGNNPPNELSWTGWAFYVASNTCTFPALINDWQQYTPTTQGNVVMQALLNGP